jgi:hypothetical protein
MKTIDTEDLKVLCRYCHGSLKFRTADGLHGPEIHTESCDCQGRDCLFCEDFSDGHMEGYAEGLKEGKRT